MDARAVEILQRAIFSEAISVLRSLTEFYPALLFKFAKIIPTFLTYKCVQIDVNILKSIKVTD